MCFRLRGAKPFVHTIFRSFSLSKLEIKIVLFQGTNDKAGHTALDAVSQEKTKKYIYPHYPKLDTASQEKTEQYIYPSP